MSTISTPPDTFALSPAFFVKSRRFMWSFYAAFIAIFLIGGVYLSMRSPEYSTITFTVIALYIFLISGIFFITYSAHFREYRAMCLVIEEGGIRRIFRKRETFLAWKDVEKMRIEYDKHMQPIGVLLWTGQKTPVIFAGFNETDILITHIQQRTSVPVETKTHKGDFSSPITPWLLIGFGIVVTVFFFLVGGKNGITYFQIATQVFLAYTFFFGRPISRFNTNFARTEKILGLVYLVIIIIQLAFLFN